MRRHSVSARSALLVLALWAVPVLAQARAGVRVVTPRGAAIEVLVDRPAGSGPVPAIVLGSGKGYHMRLPIFEQLTRKLVQQGFAVYRFDWAYFVADPKQGKSSEDRRAEIEDMQTVLALARSHPRTRQDAVFVGGKSLGSIISWRVLRSDPSLVGALLLTPVCHDKQPPEETYPDLVAEQRPTQWILGDQDPACGVRSLYRFLAGAPRAHKVAAVSGDHAYELDPAAQGQLSRTTRQTIDLVSALSIDFLAKNTPAVAKAAKGSLAAGQVSPESK